MNTIAARDARVRRAAVREGLRVTKDRRVGYLVVDARTNYLQSSEQGMSLEELEEWVRD